jgi:hypothetical protein
MLKTKIKSTTIILSIEVYPSSYQYLNLTPPDYEPYHVKTTGPSLHEFSLKNQA